MRIKFVKDHRGHSAGDTMNVGLDEANFLVKTGYAIFSKDMTPDDYKQAGGYNGKPTQLRSHKS